MRDMAHLHLGVPHSHVHRDSVTYVTRRIHEVCD